MDQRLSSLWGVTVTTVALACIADAGVNVRGNSDGVPYGRKLPAAVHLVASCEVLVVSCEGTTTTSATLVNSTWLNQGEEVLPMDTVTDGSLVNNGTGSLVCLRLEDGLTFSVPAGESLLIGPAVGGYKEGCLCSCGAGTVFIEKADCDGTCSNCNGKGPCIDPTNHQKVPSFTGCTSGWGPSSN